MDIVTIKEPKDVANEKGGLRNRLEVGAYDSFKNGPVVTIVAAGESGEDILLWLKPKQVVKLLEALEDAQIEVESMPVRGEKSC